MRRERQGFTLPEAFVSFFLLSLLFMMMFFIYRQGASAWKKSETQGELLQEAQAVTRKLTRDAERSSFASLTLDPAAPATAVAFASCWSPATMSHEYDPFGRSPVWQRFEIFYYDALAREVRWKEAPLPGAPTTTVGPLAGLAGLRSDGRVLARNVIRCDFTRGDHTLDFELELERKRYGSGRVERVELPARVYFRNS